MSANTKIFVVRMREIILSALFVALGILLILLMIIILSNRSEPHPQKQTASVTSSSVQPLYTPGIYTATIHLGGQKVLLEVIFQADKISHVQFVNLDPAVATMYPLLEPTLDSIYEATKLMDSLEDYTYTEENKYTSICLLEAIRSCAKKAALQ